MFGRNTKLIQASYHGKPELLQLYASAGDRVMEQGSVRITGTFVNITQRYREIFTYATTQ
jgi:hypothetical protein